MLTTATVWRLDGANTTLLLSNGSTGPSITWFGSRLSTELSTSMLQAHDNSALAFAGLDAVAPLLLFPDNSRGYMGAPALEGHSQSRRFAHRFALQSAIADNGQIVVTLGDKGCQLEVDVTLRLHRDSDVLTMSSRVRNTGSEPYTIDWLASATVPLPQEIEQCLSHHGRWGFENQSCRRDILPGRIDISNLHGRTSHEHSPSAICGTRAFSDNRGQVLFAHLAWSGNFSLRMERLSDGTGYLQTGVALLPGELVLEPGASYDTPSTYLTHGSEGMNIATQRFHHFARNAILPPWTRRPRPIHANSWEALYFDHDPDALCALIDASASVGAERFVLDDGWFRHRRNDMAGLGDWYVDHDIYPDGLQPVVDRVRSHGMQFGLWFEPEMVNPDSDLYRTHPEWALHVDGLDTPLARNQLALDIARQDVQDYLFERITTLVQQYGIDYIKWDMNRDLVLAGDGSRGRAAAQPTALYALLARINEACPQLEIESCSSGGARADLAVLAHTGRVWASDNIDPIERSAIQQGFLRFLPPEIMGAHVGHETAHLTGRATNLHTRAILALQGQFGFELDARRLDAHEVITLQHYTQLYKQSREWLADAVYWQLNTGSERLMASGQVAVNQSLARFSVVCTGNLPTTRPGMLSLQGLDPVRHYRLSFDSSNVSELAPFNKHLPSWCSESVTTSGELLMTLGVPLPVLPPQSAILIGCHAEAA